jgi:methylenetetrahydrofolate dehydrogenase (NADP+)/methenyltetrahydrofolate cyclohydrolase
MSLDNLIDGRAIAKEVHAETDSRVVALKAGGVVPSLIFIRVGEDPASRVYVGMKERSAMKLGIRSQTVVLPNETPEVELLDLVKQFNDDDSVHGILVQAPLPSHIDETKVFSMVSPAKDIDGFHPINAGKLILGEKSGFVPCTPGGVHELLIRSSVSVEGSEVVILGRGNIVGKPMAAILCQKKVHANATVTICHSRTRNIARYCRSADIIIAAMGVPEFVKADMVRPGATIIDVGVNRVEDPSQEKGYRLLGDVDFKGVQPVAGKITPNPGGVGPMTIAMLMRNTILAAEQQAVNF